MPNITTYLIVTQLIQIQPPGSRQQDFQISIRLQWAITLNQLSAGGQKKVILDLAINMKKMVA
ncbi:hypothetical protein UB43_06960 [Pseudomonas sp. 21]|nr:hypothetical protein UB43_06960 [Pseudomonas sp. 21]